MLDTLARVGKVSKQTFTFRRKNCRRENIQFSSQSFFTFSLNCPWRADFSCLQSRRCTCKLHVSGVTATDSPEVVGFNPAVDHNFYILYSLTDSNFRKAKNRFFQQKLGFSYKGAFLRNSPICDMTATNHFSRRISKNMGKFFDFPKKRKSYMLIHLSKKIKNKCQ